MGIYPKDKRSEEIKGEKEKKTGKRTGEGVRTSTLL